MSDSDLDLDGELLAVAGQGRRQGKGKRRRETRESSDSEDVDFQIDDEDLIEDEEDRRRLAAMPEAEREYVLFERGEKKLREIERRKLLQQAGAALEAEEEEEEGRRRDRFAKKKKSSKGEEGPPTTRAARSGREVREEAAKKSAMDQLKAARERKARTTEEKSRRKEEKESASEEAEYEEEELSEELVGGQRDDEVEISDIDEGEDYRRPRSRLEGEEEEEEEEAAFEDIKSITVRRHKLEQWVNEPFFEQTMPGCMVRLAMGERPGEDGQVRSVYMLAYVVEVEERAPGVYKDSGQAWRSPYPFGPSKAKTGKWLRVARGFSERGMPLAQVSNQGITQEEFEAWQRACKEQRRRPITRQEVEAARKKLLQAENYTYTAEDVAKVLEAKRAAGRGMHNLALEKARKQRERDAAAEAGDEELVARLDAEIAEMEARIAERKAGDKKKGSMAAINKRNADMNFQNAIQNVSNKVEGAFTAKSAKSTTLDPFSRRATRPMVYWNTKQQGRGEEEGMAGPDTAQAAPAGETPLSPRAAAAAAQQRAEAAAALERVVDLSGLDLSVLDLPPRMPQVAKKLLGSRWSLGGGVRHVPPRTELAAAGKLLTMQDYKRRQGLA